MRHFPAIKRKRLAVLSLSLCLFRIWEWFVWRKWRRWCTMVPTGSWRRTRSWFVLGAQCCDIRQETEIFVRSVLCRPSLWKGLICCYIFFADLLLANRGKTHKRKSSAEREPRGKKRKKQENSEEKPAKKRPRTGDRREKRQDKQVAKRTKTRPKLNRKTPSKFKPQSRTKRKKQRWSRNWRCKNVNSS